MKKRITNCLLAVAMMSATAGTFLSCKDYDGDSALKESVAQNTNLIDALTQQVNTLKTAQADCQTKCQASIAALEKLVNMNTASIAANGGKIATNAQNIELLNKQLAAQSADIAANKKAIADAQEAIAKNGKAIDLLNEAVAANGKTIAQNSKDIIDLQARVSDLENADKLINETIAKNAAAANTRIDSVVVAINDVNKTALKALELAEAAAGNGAFTDLQNAVVGLQNDVKVLYQKAMADSTLAAKAFHLADSATTLANANLTAISGLTGDMSALKVTVGDLETAYKAADETLKTQLDGLNDRVTALENAYKLQVTSITVNGTHSPLVGYYALPTGDVRSTILAAYYGDPETFRFPTATLSFYADQNNALTAGDLEVTGMTNAAVEGGKTIVTEDGKEGNAGTLYLTLNPTSVDLTGKTFTLVNSQGKESLVQLSGVESSDKELAFGYTRANTNGFYEAKATVSAEAAKAVKPNVRLADMKEVVAELKNTWRHGPTDLTKVVSLVYNNVQNVLPALALKTSWENNGTVNSALSQYSVAATAVKPLSFATLKDLNVKLPQITALKQIEGKLDGYLNKIDTVYVEPTAGLEGYTLHVVHDGGKDFHGGVNDIDGFVDKINSKFGSIAKKGLAKANSYVNKYNNFANRLSGIINRFNLRLQPVLFIQKDNEFYQLSTVPYGTDALESGAKINMTTYTAELLAPAYKKWVAVTNVWNNADDAVKDKVLGQDVTSAQNGDAALKSALQSANGGDNMNKVVFGTEVNAMLGTLESGKVYEISYSAVDYAGKVAARKFYVRGK